MLSPKKVTFPPVDLVATGDEVHERRFTGAVSPDQDTQLAFFYGHIEAIHRTKAAEVHLKVLDL